MAKQRRRDAAIIAGVPEGEALLADLARVAEKDPQAFFFLRKAVALIVEARAAVGA